MFDCRHRPLVLPPEVEARLIGAYQQPRRAYHNVTHIAELLRHFDQVADDIGWLVPADIYAAILFHDAVYVPGAQDNEVWSAAWAREAGLSERVAELVLMTARHGGDANDQADRDAALFLDCDMAIIGAPSAEFDAYDAAIAAEYNFITPEKYAFGRREFLTRLLARPRIFLSDYFHLRFDAAARRNLRRRLA